LLTVDGKAKQETAELLQRLIQIQSFNPPGNENKIAAFIKVFLAQNGIDTMLVPLQEGRSSAWHGSREGS